MKNIVKLSVICAATLSACLSLSHAQEVHKTGEVKVTAGRVEQQLLDIPMSVSVLTAEEIRDSSARNIGELLADVPGVEVGGDGSQGLKRIKIRGENEYRSLILIDGQKVSEHKSMSGPALLIDPSSVERIEVIKGPASVLYGSDAIGGVINIITKKGSKKPFEAEASVGWNGAGHGWSESVSLGGSAKGFKYQLDAGYQSHGNIKTPKGYQKNTDFRQKNLGAFLSYDLTDNFTVGMHADIFDSKINSSSWTYENDPDSDFFVKIPKWRRDKISLFAEVKDVNEYLTRLRVDGYWQKNHKLMQNYVSQSSKSPKSSTSVITDSHADNRIKTLGSSLQADWQLGDNNFLITGYEFAQDRLTANTEADFTMSMRMTGMPRPMLDQAYVTDRYVKGKETTNAIFAAMETTLPYDLSLNYGVRYTWVSSELSKASSFRNGYKTTPAGTTIFNNTPVNDSGTPGSENNSRPVFNLGVIWKGLDNTSLRAQWAQGFRVPNLQEKFLINSMGGGTVYGNPNLKPEKSNNFEIGARYSTDLMDIDAALFYNLSDDYISTEIVGDADSGISRYVNADKAKTFGSELSLNLRATENFNPYFSLSWIKRKTEWADGTSTYASGTPEFTARYGLRTIYPLFNGKWTTDTYLRSSTAKKSYSLSTKETTRIAGYTTLNFATAYHFGPKQAFSANFEVLNITNQLYGYETSIYEPGRRFNFKLTARY
ncbi:MAG: TonB-dependent receptor [Burkholderiales bacterium]|nr:TonB-dependent receptor [Burkholderiales bacterium]